MTKIELRRKIVDSGMYQVFQVGDGSEKFIKNDKSKSFFVLGERNFSFGEEGKNIQTKVLYETTTLIRKGLRFAIEYTTSPA